MLCRGSYNNVIINNRLNDNNQNLEEFYSDLEEIVSREKSPRGSLYSPNSSACSSPQMPEFSTCNAKYSEMESVTANSSPDEPRLNDIKLESNNEVNQNKYIIPMCKISPQNYTDYERAYSSEPQMSPINDNFDSYSISNYNTQNWYVNQNGMNNSYGMTQPSKISPVTYQNLDDRNENGNLIDIQSRFIPQQVSNGLYSGVPSYQNSVIQEKNSQESYGINWSCDQMAYGYGNYEPISSYNNYPGMVLGAEMASSALTPAPSSLSNQQEPFEAILSADSNHHEQRESQPLQIHQQSQRLSQEQQGHVSPVVIPDNNNLPNLVDFKHESPSSNKTSLNRTKATKRVRTAFTNEQLMFLQNEYQRNAYLCRPRRIEVSQQLGLAERKVKIWFQNYRMKIKKQKLDSANASPEPRVPTRGPGRPRNQKKVQAAQDQKKQQNIVGRLLSFSPTAASQISTPSCVNIANSTSMNQTTAPNLYFQSSPTYTVSNRYIDENPNSTISHVNLPSPSMYVPQVLANFHYESTSSTKSVSETNHLLDEMPIS